MPPDPPSKSASGAQQDLGLNEHPYRNLSYALVREIVFEQGQPHDFPFRDVFVFVLKPPE